MSHTIDSTLDEQYTVELTEQELEAINGAWGDDFFPFNNSTSLAVSTIAFSTNNNNCCW
jgi:hypothetical protein